MIDPVSIAGLTIAVFDQLLKLGERTHEFISDARGLDEEFVLLKRKLAEENNRTRQLKLLLFEETPVYGGTTLFEAFDEDSQEQIKLGLLEPLGKLHEGVELLQRRYAVVKNKSPKSDSQESLAILSTLRRSTRSPMRYINWSFRDKKRATVILNEFSDINHRIHENIKLLCLASSMGVSSQQHLHHLHTDPHSVVLGYSVDANLRITSETAQAGHDDLELPDTPWLPILTECRLAQGNFGLAACDKKDIIQEFRHYSPTSWDPVSGSKSVGVDSRTRSLVNGLARILQQPREHIFMIPRCLGWKFLPEKCQIAFVFDVPAGRDPEPFSLLSLLRNRNLRTSLNDRLNIAFGLARSIAQLQLVRWVHESFRSENILFFPVTDTKNVPVANTKKVPATDTKNAGSPSPSEERINYAEPWIFGFEFSRPEDFFSSGATDISLERDVYRHPDRQGIPETRFNKLHDIYALGVVLLEIGLWESWDQMQHIENAHRLGRDFLQKALIKQAERRLAAKMGNRYKEVVLKCLQGKFGVSNDTRDDLKLQQAFRSGVVDVLERAVASV